MIEGFSELSPDSAGKLIMHKFASDLLRYQVEMEKNGAIPISVIQPVKLQCAVNS